jgi:hypothetical protein
MLIEYRARRTRLPFRARDGQSIAFKFPRPIDWQSEESLLLTLLASRKLFGEVYSRLQPDYFWAMPPNSGVLCAPFVPTSTIVPNARRPGDIDLLLLPYEGEQLVLSRAMATEVKVWRASYARQGRSPNDFGFSQASALLGIGFPYVAVMHLVVSDASPKEAWRKVLSGRLQHKDRVKMLGTRLKDMLPADLIARSYGRLEAHSIHPTLGLAAVYIDRRSGRELDMSHRTGGRWYPQVREAHFNADLNTTLCRSIAAYYEANSKRFLETPRFDPV